MFTRSLIAGAFATSLLAAGLVTVGTGAQAGDDFNRRTHLPPSMAAKVAKHRALGLSQQGSARDFGSGGQECGSIELGNTENRRIGQRGPREVVIVADEVINVNDRCRAR